MENGLRQRVRGGKPVLGAFIKTASHQVAEALGGAGLDFAVIDAEHAPFDMADIDKVVLGGQAAGLPCLVRPPDLTASFVGRCLDLGAAGILAPHVDSAERARGVVSAAKYATGQRGYSPSTRAGGFGATPAGAYRAAADANTCLWCQIEDASALPRLDEIAAVEAVDCLFLGRADLALSLGADGPGDPKVRAAVLATIEAARRRRRAVGAYVADMAEIPELLALGVTVFACGSDQSYLTAGGRRAREALSRAIDGERP